MRRVVFAAFILLACTVSAGDKFVRAAPVQLDKDGEKWAEKTLKKLTLEEKVGQLFLIWSRAEFLNTANPEYQKLLESMRRFHVGSFGLTVRAEGPVVFRNQPYEAAMLTNALQRESELPLLFAADFERGLSMRLNGATFFPHAMAFGAAGKAEYVERFAAITAQEARAIGVHWNFFPVADVNSAPMNPIINTRAFGEDPQQVSELVTAYIRAARKAGMLTTAKHFPGHGDTDTDSHLGVARVGGDRARLEAVELEPFRQTIRAGVDSVMVAHVSVPALEPDPERIATTSSFIVTELLKRQLGFPGLVVTDAMDMAAVTRLYAEQPGRAAVEALKAGNDMVLIPADLEASYNAVLAAVRSGELPEARIDESVRKVLRAKASLGLHKARLVDINELATLVGHPQSVAFGQQVADESVTLVRENGLVLPLTATRRAPNGFPNLLPAARPEGTTAAPPAYPQTGRRRVLALVFTDDVRSESGRGFERALRSRIPEARVLWLEPRTANALLDTVMEAVEQSDTVIAAVAVIPTSGKVVMVNGVPANTISLLEGPAYVLSSVLESAAPRTVVVALGNPYIASSFPAVQNYLCTFSNAPVSELSAVKALFGEIAVQGHLPVSIPGIAERGSGMARQAAAPAAPAVAASH